MHQALKPSVTYQREILTAELINELLPLANKHFDEIAHFKDIPLKIDVARYLKLEETGIVRVFVARETGGQLIGYAVFFLNHNLRYSSSYQAVQDVVYIDPAKRGFGAQFIAWCDEQLRQENVQVVCHHVKKAHPQLGILLERLGYEVMDIIYVRKF